MKNFTTVMEYWIFAALVTVVGLLGIVLAAGATDAAMQAFGLALAAFAVLFDFWAINRAHGTDA